MPKFLQQFYLELRGNKKSFLGFNKFYDIEFDVINLIEGLIKLTHDKLGFLIKF